MYKPQLVKAYSDACKRYYHYTPFITANLYPKFKQVERKLLDEGIRPQDYAQRLCSHLVKWCKSKKFKCLPANILLGAWAYNLYKDRFWEGAQPITLDQEVISILAAEEFRLLQYAHTHDCSVKDAAEHIHFMLGESWRDYQDSHIVMHDVRQQAQEMFKAWTFTHSTGSLDLS